MQQLNDEQINERIESFISKKHQQYPELALRGTEKRSESLASVIADKISEVIQHVRLARLAH